MSSPSPDLSTVSPRRIPEDWAIIPLLIASLLLKLHNLAHARLSNWDEVFHATVARNLLRHPLIPTLIDTPYLADQYWNWHTSHIWLHKPILALWQIAISFRLFGVNAVALRLPSLLLSTASVWVTYLVGSRLLDRRAALVAAAIQAFNPTLVGQVEGFLMADHVDTALLFWMELSIYFLLRAVAQPNRINPLLCGIACGLAYLSKSFPGLLPLPLALLAVLILQLPWRGFFLILVACL